MNTVKKSLKELELLLENAETREVNARRAMQTAQLQNNDDAHDAAYNQMIEAQNDITYYDNEIRIARWTNSE